MPSYRPRMDMGIPDGEKPGKGNNKNNPKPPREDVYGKRDRRDVYPVPVDTIRNSDRAKKNKEKQEKANPAAEKNKKKAQSYNVKVYGEAKPVDERGVVRRGLGGPAAAGQKKGAGRGMPDKKRRTPQEMDPGMTRRRGPLVDPKRRTPQEMDPGMTRRRRPVPTPPPGGRGMPRRTRPRKPGDRRA